MIITTVFIDRDGTGGGNGHFKMIEDFKLCWFWRSD